MKIPENINQILSGGDGLEEEIRLFIKKAKPYISNSNLPFFPEYTDHSINHNIDILNTCHELISEKSLKVTSKDIAILIGAIFLHDIAMHLTEDGFCSLIDNSDSNSLIELDEKPWKRLWIDYLSDAKRWDERKLISMFGEAEPITIPALDPLKMTLKDRLLIGEFIRRYHGRLAHEIAIWGFPSAKRDRINLLSDLSHDHADLIGIIARSHTLPLRDCFSYLDKKYHLREYNGIHAIFLMVLLRVADYLQIQEKRAPKEVVEVKKLRSPISQGEWKVHHCIKNITDAIDDPEAIYIQAQPSDVKTFIRVRDWLSGIQHEIDSSWAILGEVYGRYQKEGLNNLGITLRRVKSNIDNLKAFSNSIDYIPEKISFDAANPDLLKLLIEPLYGNKPEIGIRELVQNAVDAVRERKELLSRNGFEQSITEEADVVVTIELNKNEDPLYLIVDDKGIGMTSEVVKNYFLNAGSTFRNSEFWKRNFENESGKSKVLRSGRFGVGVLAAFLIGDEIAVTTRHSNEDQGIAFETRLDTDAISVKRISRDVGTTIRVKIRESSKESLQYLYSKQRLDIGTENWDWYCLESPKVTRIIKPYYIELKQKYRIPNANAELPPNWRSLKHAQYQDIQWTYSKVHKLICNGLKVIEDKNFETLEDCFFLESLDFYIHKPNVSVFDPDGKLPLNLQRDTLIFSDLPFQKELIDDIIKCFLAYTIKYFPKNSKVIEKGALFTHNKMVTHRIVEKDDSEYRDKKINVSPFCFTKYGGTITDEWLIKNLRLSSLIIYSKDYLDNNEKIYFPGLQKNQGVIGINEYDGFNKRLDIVRGCIGAFYNSGDTRFDILSKLKVDGKRVVIGKSWYEETINTSGRIMKDTVSKIEIEEDLGNGYLLKIGECPAITDTIDTIKKQMATIPPDFKGVMAEWYLSENQDDVQPSEIAQIWHEILGQALIPYDYEQRKSELSKAFEILEDYMSYEVEIK